MFLYSYNKAIICGLIIGLGTVFIPLRPVVAASCRLIAPGHCETDPATNRWWAGNPDFSTDMHKYILDNVYRDLIVKDWWVTKFEPALKKMASQLNASQLQNTGMMGTLFDGLSMNKSLLSAQTLQAAAYKNYTPGEGLCRFGTNVRSLASADLGRIRNQIALASIAQGRQLGTKGSSAESGPILDRQARFDQFTRLYCDPGDNNGLLAPLCGAAPTTTAKRFNKDISVARTLFAPKTLNLNFADGKVTADEEDIIALASNLYGPDVLTRETEFSFSGENATNKTKYLSLRQLIAYRNVAQNSFNIAAASRGTGGVGVNTYMQNILRELGMSPEESATYLSNDTGAPSYHAQMEVLTKKIYQNPNFYTNLMDKPANVDRQIAAIDAIGVMQDRDMYQSLERQELLLSLLLEMKTRTVQRDVDRNLSITGRN